MQLIKKYEKLVDCNTTIFRFINNRNIAKISIELADDFTNYFGSKINIEYALNGITTVLIPLKTLTLGYSNSICFVLDTPVSASHIYITIENDVQLENVGIYEIVNEKKDNYYPLV